MWRGFCEHLRSCGRNGTLFVYVLGLIFIAAPMGVYGVLVLLGLSLLGAGWVSGEVSSQANRFEPLGKMPPLSDRDLYVARSKLLNSSARVRNPNAL